MWSENIYRNYSEKMKESLIFNYRFVVLVTGIFVVLLFLLFGATHAIPENQTETEAQPRPTSEFLSATTTTTTTSEPITTTTTTKTTTTSVDNSTSTLPGINDTVTSTAPTSTTTSSTEAPPPPPPPAKVTAALERIGKVARLGGVPFSSNSLASTTPQPSSTSEILSSPSPSPSSDTSTAAVSSTLSSSSSSSTSTSEISAKSFLNGNSSLEQIVGGGSGDSLTKKPEEKLERSLSLPQNQNQSTQTQGVKQVTSKTGEVDSTKLTKLIVKSTPTPISVQDKRIRAIWGGECTYAVWNVCNRIKSWGGDYLVPDKLNPGKMIKRYYRINCVEKPEQTFCLRNGWTVARCHMLCMAQCNVDFKLNFDKVVSYDGECRWPILGRK